MIEINTGLMELLPEFYADIKDYQQILATEETELEQLATFINAVHDNFFVQTIDEAAASDWEELLGIANTEGTSLEFRRTRILNRITIKPPFTLKFLYQKLDELIGEGKWSVAVDYDGYTLYVESSAASQEYATEVAFTINHIKPAHIVYINRPLISEVLVINETIHASYLTYNYKLGSWSLGSDPFSLRGEENLYKLANERSLTSDLLSDVATYVSGDIASARLNDTLVITDLTKSVSENILTVTYAVPAAQTTAITKIELLDGDGNVLTTSTVYIPLSSELEIKHTLLTKEAA